MCPMVAVGNITVPVADSDREKAFSCAAVECSEALWRAGSLQSRQKMQMLLS